MTAIQNVELDKHVWKLEIVDLLYANRNVKVWINFISTNNLKLEFNIFKNLLLDVSVTEIFFSVPYTPKNDTECEDIPYATLDDFQDAIEQCDKEPDCKIIVNEECKDQKFSLCKKLAALAKDETSCAFVKNPGMKNIAARV